MASGTIDILEFSPTPRRQARSRRKAGGQTKKAQREASIESLLGAALPLFISRGYHATSVDQIAQAAGLTKGALYFYFKSKSDLLMHLLGDVEALCVEPALGAIAEAGPGPRDRLVAFLHAQSAVGAERADLMLLGILASIEFDRAGDAIEARLRQIFGRMADALREIVEAGQASGDFRADLSVEEMVHTIMALNQGCLLEWYRHHGALDGPGLVRAMRGMLLDGYCAPLAQAN